MYQIHPIGVLHVGAHDGEEQDEYQKLYWGPVTWIEAMPKKVESLNEVTPTGKETDEEMNIKAEKLMAMIAKRIPQNIIKTITTPIAQREVIAAFAELIGVPRNGLNKLIAGLKDLAKQQQQQQGPTAQTGQVGQEQPITEKRVITKNQLTESLKPNKVIKTIKVKDIK